MDKFFLLNLVSLQSCIRVCGRCLEIWYAKLANCYKEMYAMGKGFKFLVGV